MALPLDETISAGQAAHIDDHETIATVLNALLPWSGQSTDAVDTFPRWALLGQSAVPTSGTLYIAYFTPLVNKTIGTITIASGVTAGSSGLTLARLGLYTAAANGDLTLVARTASNTSLLGSTNTLYAEALSTTGGYPASYALVAGTRYAVGLLQVGTTPARYLAAGSLGSSSGQGLLAPIMAAEKSGQTDISGNIATVAAIGMNALSTALWARLS